MHRTSLKDSTKLYFGPTEANVKTSWRDSLVAISPLRPAKLNSVCISLDQAYIDLNCSTITWPYILVNIQWIKYTSRISWTSEIVSWINTLQSKIVNAIFVNTNSCFHIWISPHSLENNINRENRGEKICSSCEKKGEYSNGFIASQSPDPRSFWIFCKNKKLWLWLSYAEEEENSINEATEKMLSIPSKCNTLPK